MKVLNVAIGCASAIALAVVVTAQSGFAANSGAPATQHASESLLQLIRPAFADLTPCETSVLVAASKGTIASCAEGLNDDAPGAGARDPRFNPAYGDHWSPDRDVRAALLRWLLVDREASKFLDPAGVRIRGARISAPLNLRNVTIPVEISLSYCYLPHGVDLSGAKIPELRIINSSAGELRLESISTTRDLDLEFNTVSFHWHAHTAGVVDLNSSQVGGALMMSGCHVNSPGDSESAVNARGMTTKQGVYFTDSFRTDGVVDMTDANVGADLHFDGARFVPMLPDAKLPAFLNDARAASMNGLLARGIAIKGALWWTEVVTTPRTFLDLTDAKVATLIDDESSWPHPGNLLIDGFTYGRIACPVGADMGLYWARRPAKGCALDAAARLKWLGLQAPDIYYPQPYRQLAAFLTARGDMSGARSVYIAAQNQEMSRGKLSVMQRVWGWLLWATIDYGYESTWALLWAAIIALIGGVVVRMAHDAGVMKPVQPERRLTAPMIYSIDVFVPFVDLRLQRNWWPDPTAHGTAKLFGLRVPISGSAVRIYLWLHIIAGYTLTALFVGGLSGLVHNR